MVKTMYSKSLVSRSKIQIYKKYVFKNTKKILQKVARKKFSAVESFRCGTLVL